MLTPHTSPCVLLLRTSYPYAFMAFDSPPNYGAYQSLTADQDCPLTSDIEYLAEYGEAYVLLLQQQQQHSSEKNGTSTTSTVSLTANCVVDVCHANQFFDGSMCIDCPDGSIAPAESTNRSACIPCAAGLSVAHPTSPECVVDRTLSPTQTPTTASPTCLLYTSPSPRDS